MAIDFSTRSERPRAPLTVLPIVARAGELG